MELDDKKTNLDNMGLSKRLLNCLKKVGINYLEEIPNDEAWIESLSIEGFGKTARDELQHFLARVKNPSDTIYVAVTSTNEESVLKEIDVKEDSSLFERIEGLLLQWYNIRDNSSEYQVIWRRFGLGGNTETTLGDIGLYLGITNERVRQIESRDLKRIGFLINGHVDPYTKTCLPTQMTNEILIVKTMVLKNVVTEFSTFNLCYTEQFRKEIVNRQYGMFRLLLNCWNYLFLDTDNNKFIVSEQWISKKLFMLLAKEIIDFLKKEVEPVNEFDLITAIKKLIPDKQLRNEHVIEFCKANPFITISNNGCELCYELNQIHLLKSYVKVYRILKFNKGIMHLSEINAEIKRLQFLETGDVGSAINSTNILSQSELFSPVGKSGKWTLSKNNISSLSTPDLIQEYLDRKGLPVSTEELLSFIKSNHGREQTDASRLSILLHQNRDRFSRTNDGLITTIQRYVGCKNSDNRMSSEQVYELIQKIFTTHGSTTITRQAFLKEASESGIVQSTIYALLKRGTYLRTNISEDGVEYVSFIKKDESANNENTLRYKIVEILTSQLQNAPDNTMELNELVKNVLRYTDCKRPYVYRILNDFPQFIKKNMESPKGTLVVLAGK